MAEKVVLAVTPLDVTGNKPDPPLPHELLSIVIDYALTPLLEDLEYHDSVDIEDADNAAFFEQKRAICDLTLTCKEACKQVCRSLKAAIGEAKGVEEEIAAEFAWMRAPYACLGPDGWCPNCECVEGKLKKARRKVRALMVLLDGMEVVLEGN